MLNFTGSSPQANSQFSTLRRRAQIRSGDDIVHSGTGGFSVFMWLDSDSGVSSWQEKHGLKWSEAMAIARQWLN
jgi:hypothetical protein